MHVIPDGGIRSPRPCTGHQPGFGAQKHFTKSLVHGGDEGEVVDVQNHSKMLTALVMLVSRDVVRLENQVEGKWIEGHRKPSNDVDVKRAFKEQNTKRVGDFEAAQKKLRAVARDADLTRPFQRIEIDDWIADLVTILATSGLIPFRPEENKAHRYPGQRLVPDACLRGAGPFASPPRGRRRARRHSANFHLLHRRRRNR